MLRAPNTCSAESKGCTGFDRKVTGNSDQPAKLSQAQREFSTTAGAALSLCEG